MKHIPLLVGVLLFAALWYVANYHIDWLLSLGETLGNWFLAPLLEDQPPQT